MWIFDNFCGFFLRPVHFEMLYRSSILKPCCLSYLGTPWTEEEHRMFLLGLQKLGKGDWRGISRNFVISRTPTQVASHAQKYFIRQTNSTRRKRRSSLFDMVSEIICLLYTFYLVYSLLWWSIQFCYFLCINLNCIIYLLPLV